MASPQRRPLHERSSSHVNSQRPTIRLVQIQDQDQDQDQDHDQDHDQKDEDWDQDENPQSHIDNKTALSAKPGSASAPTTTAPGFPPPHNVPVSHPDAASLNAHLSTESVHDAASAALTLVPRPSSPSTATSSRTLFDAHRIAQIEKKFGSVLDYSGRARGWSTIRNVVPSSPASSNDGAPSALLNATAEETLSSYTSSSSSASSSASLPTLATSKETSPPLISTNCYVPDTASDSPPPPTEPDSTSSTLEHPVPPEDLPRPTHPLDHSDSNVKQSSPSSSQPPLSRPSVETIDEPLPLIHPPDTHDSLQTALERGSHPPPSAVQPPSPSDSHASSIDRRDQLADLPNLGRMVEPQYRDPWSSRLSTINSESEPDAVSQSGLSARWRRDSDQRPTMSSVPSSVGSVPPSLNSSGNLSLPSPVLHNARDLSDDSRDLSEESEDVVGELYSPRLRHQPSYFSVFSTATDSRPGSSRPASSANAVRTGSRSGTVLERSSFMESALFPAWARSYYRRGSDTLPSTGSTTSLSLPFVYAHTPSGSRLNTAISAALSSGSGRSRTPSLTDHFPSRLYHPRKRPRQQNPPTGSGPRPETSDSEASWADLERDVPAPMSADNSRRAPRGPRPLPPSDPRYPRYPRASYSPNARGNSRPGTSYSQWRSMPRLTRDRRSAGGLSGWHAPSLGSSVDDPLRVFSARGNRQLGLFVLGFVCPLAWMVAAVLPLPDRPPDARPESEARRRSAAWREDRASQLSERGGTTTFVDPEGRGEVVERNGRRVGASSASLVDSLATDVERARRGAQLRIEQGLARGYLEAEMDMLDATRKWAKQGWWRRVNRAMAVLGGLLVVLIIVLVVMATRFPDVMGR